MKKYYYEVRILNYENSITLEQQMNLLLKQGWMMRGDMNIIKDNFGYLSFVQMMEYEHEVINDE